MGKNLIRQISPTNWLLAVWHCPRFQSEKEPRLRSVERRRDWSLDLNAKNLSFFLFLNIVYVHNIYLYFFKKNIFIKQIYFFVLETLENIIMFVGCHFVLKILRLFFWETIEKCFLSSLIFKNVFYIVNLNFVSSSPHVYHFFFLFLSVMARVKPIRFFNIGKIVSPC